MFKTTLIEPQSFVSKCLDNNALEGLAQWLTGEACLAPVPSSTLHVHACQPHGVLPVCWACRMFSRPGE